MTDTNDTTKKPSGGKTLTLKKTETSTVKQSFSHGRTKAVVVEKKRTLGPVTTAKSPQRPPRPRLLPHATPHHARAWSCVNSPKKKSSAAVLPSLMRVSMKSRRA